MNRANILAEMGIETWVRSDTQGTELHDSAENNLSKSAALHSVDSSVTGNVDSNETKQNPGPRSEAASVATQLEDSLEALRAKVLACQLCSLSESRTNAVPGVGGANAQWFFIGKAPGVEEDRQGEPFVGRSGQLLENIFRALGVSRENVYISSVLKCHPPGNRDISSKEIDICRSHLTSEILMVQPQVVVVLGDVATREVLQSEMPIDKLRGKVHRLVGSDIPCVVTYHPAAVLHDPAQKKHVWDDLLLAKSVLPIGADTAKMNYKEH